MYLHCHHIWVLIDLSVFVCGQFGFVEFAEIQVLLAILKWQNAHLGCFSVDFTYDGSAGVLESIAAEMHSRSVRGLLINRIHDGMPFTFGARSLYF